MGKTRRKSTRGGGVLDELLDELDKLNKKVDMLIRQPGVDSRKRAPYDMTMDRVFQVENTLSQHDNELRFIYRTLRDLNKSEDTLNEKLQSLIEKVDSKALHKFI
jgi:uncharacterized coiled-coil DUF342 family protein